MVENYSIKSCWIKTQIIYPQRITANLFKHDIFSVPFLPIWRFFSRILTIIKTVRKVMILLDFWHSDMKYIGIICSNHLPTMFIWKFLHLHLVNYSKFAIFFPEWVGNILRFTNKNQQAILHEVHRVKNLSPDWFQKPNGYKIYENKWGAFLIFRRKY